MRPVRAWTSGLSAIETLGKKPSTRVRETSSRVSAVRKVPPISEEPRLGTTTATSSASARTWARVAAASRMPSPRNALQNCPLMSRE